MKIIFSNYDDLKNPYYRGGGAHAIHEIGKRLAQNHNVVVLTGKYPGSSDKTIDKVRYKRIGLANTGPKMSQIIFQCLLPFYVIAEKFDVWIENFTPPFSTAFLPFFTKKPVIGLTQLLNAKEIGEKYNLPIFAAIERFGISIYRNFISLTENQKARIQSINPKANVAVIPNGVNIRKYSRNVRQSYKYMLFMGRLDTYHKGLDLLISAYALCNGRTDLKLVIAGDGLGEQQKYLNELIASYNLKKNIILKGYVAGRKKDELYRNCEFAVFPSRFEGFGLVILEALSFGKPVIIFDIKDLGWVSNSVSLKVKPFSIEKLSDAIIAMSEKQAVFRSKANAVKPFIKKLEWKIISRKYADFLQKVAG